MHTLQSDFSFPAQDVDPEALAAAFAEFGVAVIEDAVDDARCGALHREIERHFASTDTGSAAHRAAGGAMRVFQCEVWCWNPLGERIPIPEFVSLRDDALIQRATEACLDVDWSASSGCLVMKSATGGVGQSWHQDCPYGQASRFNINRLVYPADVTAGDGAVVVVPGSHRRGPIPAGDAQEALPGEIQLTPRAGTLVLVHGWTWHRVTGNRSGRDRVSINLRAYPAGCPTDEPTRYGVYRNGTADFDTGTVLEHARTSHRPSAS